MAGSDFGPVEGLDDDFFHSHSDSSGGSTSGSGSGGGFGLLDDDAWYGDFQEASGKVEVEFTVLFLVGALLVVLVRYFIESKVLSKRKEARAAIADSSADSGVPDARLLSLEGIRRQFVAWSGIVWCDGQVLGALTAAQCNTSLIGLFHDGTRRHYSLSFKRDPRDTPQSVRKVVLVGGIAVTIAFSLVFSSVNHPCVQVCSPSLHCSAGETVTTEGCNGRHQGLQCPDLGCFTTMKGKKDTSLRSSLLVTVLGGVGAPLFQRLGLACHLLSRPAKQAFYGFVAVASAGLVFAAYHLAHRTENETKQLASIMFAAKFTEWLLYDPLKAAVRLFVGKLVVNRDVDVPLKLQLGQQQLAGDYKQSGDGGASQGLLQPGLPGNAAAYGMHGSSGPKVAGVHPGGAPPVAYPPGAAPDMRSSSQPRPGSGLPTSAQPASEHNWEQAPNRTTTGVQSAPAHVWEDA